MIDFDAALSRLRTVSQCDPLPERLPNEDTVRDLEEKAGIPFPPEFKRYLLEASDIGFATLEPVTAVDPADYTYFLRVLHNAREMGVPENLVPLCEDNSNYFCVNPSGVVVYWDHNGRNDERWESIAAWIDSVWVGENI